MHILSSKLKIFEKKSINFNIALVVFGIKKPFALFWKVLCILCIFHNLTRKIDILNGLAIKKLSRSYESVFTYYPIYLAVHE